MVQNREMSVNQLTLGEIAARHNRGQLESEWTMMRTTHTKPVRTVLPYAANVDAFRLWTAADQTLAVAAWWIAAALVATILATVLGLPGKGMNGITQLEQLAPQIERLSALPPATKDRIDRVLAEQHALAGSGNAALETRRQAAIARMNGALEARKTTQQAEAEREIAGR